jgi:hypothetical protein
VRVIRDEVIAKDLDRLDVPLDESSLERYMERMIHRAPDEFSLSASPTAEVDAQEAFGRVFTGERAPLRDRAMLLISGLLTNDEGSVVTEGGDRVSVKVISEPRSVRVEIRDAGSGVVLGGLRRRHGPTSRGWSPHLLSKEADRWGLVSGTEGAWVWFEMDLPE